MLRHESVNYIIEKMRGDSLTPLGTKSKEVVGADVFSKVEDNSIIKDWLNSSDDKYTGVVELARFLRINKGTTLNYGKWELVVDPKKFYNLGFYYKTRLDTKERLYAFLSNYDGHIPSSGVVRLQCRLGCSLATADMKVLTTSCPLSFGDSLESITEYIRKVLGIKTFLEDYKKYYLG